MAPALRSASPRKKQGWSLMLLRSGRPARRTETLVPAIPGRLRRITTRREITLRISVTVAIDLAYNEPTDRRTYKLDGALRYCTGETPAARRRWRARWL